MTPPNQIVYDLPSEEYHALKAPEYVSGSALVPLMTRVPAEVFAPFDGSEFTEFGTVMHTFFLQPELFGEGKSHHTEPETYPSKDGPKKWTGQATYCKDWYKDHPGICLPAKGKLSVETISEIRESVMSFPLAKRMLELDGQSEVSMFSACPLTGLQLKCRTDRLCKDDSGKPLIWDLKFNSNPYAFERQNVDRHYEIQVEMNTRIAQLNGIEAMFCYLVIGTEFPHVVRVVTPDQETRAKGLHTVNRLLPMFATCKARNHWPAYKVNDDLTPFGSNGLEEVKLRILE